LARPLHRPTRGETIMPENPFPTLQKWQQQKKTYGIPGKVIKSGAFGEKMDKLRMAFNSKGGKSVNATNFADVLQVLQQGDVLVDEWLAKAKTMKASEFTNKQAESD
jgi:S-adenosylmethionine:tRNA-ribosyltransferase-isomerase (queuine synthetase)